LEETQEQGKDGVRRERERERERGDREGESESKVRGVKETKTIKGVKR